MASLTSNAQPNPKFAELENFMEKMGIEATYSQINEGEGIEHRVKRSFWINHTHVTHPDEKTRESMQRMRDSVEAISNRPKIMAIDSIRRAFSELARNAAESYQYEYHRGKNDTIEYSIAFTKEEGDSSTSWKIRNAMAFRYMREVGRFHYHNTITGTRGNEYGNGVYSHHYYEDHPLGLSWKQLKPFDSEGFQRLIQPLLNDALKQKGVKSFPIHWQHDEGYKDDLAGGLQFKMTWFTDLDEENKHTGLTTGTDYVFPIEQEALALYVHHQLDSIAFAYVNAHPEQLYSYHKTDRYNPGSWAHMLSGSVHYHTKEKAYELNCFRDDDGFHLVSITTIGELWVPKDWQKLKSWVNGERVERTK